MVIFRVSDMYLCDSAVAIVKAVKAVDEAACVFVHMARYGVEITPGVANAQALSNAISGAGFTPVLLSDEPSDPGRFALKLQTATTPDGKRHLD